MDVSLLVDVWLVWFWLIGSSNPLNFLTGLWFFPRLNEISLITSSGRTIRFEMSVEDFRDEEEEEGRLLEKMKGTFGLDRILKLGKAVSLCTDCLFELISNGKKNMNVDANGLKTQLE